MARTERVYFRVAVKFPLTFCPRGSQFVDKATTSDISTDGLAFLSKRKLNLNQSIDLEFRLPGQRHVIRILAEVRHQSEKSKSEKEPLRIKGVLFRGIEREDVVRIGKYIDSCMDITLPRTLISTAGIAAAILFFLRGLYYDFMSELSPDFVRGEWLGSLWQQLSPYGIGLFHTLYAVVFALACICFLPRYKHAAPRLMAVFAVPGILVQISRVYLKFPFLFENDTFARIEYVFECVLAAVFVGILLAMIPAIKQYAAIMKKVDTHTKAQLKYQEDARKTATSAVNSARPYLRGVPRRRR